MLKKKKLAPILREKKITKTVMDAARQWPLAAPHVRAAGRFWKASACGPVSPLKRKVSPSQCYHVPPKAPTPVCTPPQPALIYLGRTCRKKHGTHLFLPAALCGQDLDRTQQFKRKIKAIKVKPKTRSLQFFCRRLPQNTLKSSATLCNGSGNYKDKLIR